MKKIFCLIFAVGFLVLASGLAQVQKPSDLKFEPLKYEPPDPKAFRTVLANGLRAYIQEDRALPIVSVSALVNFGGLYVPKDKQGLESLLSGALIRGGTKAKEGIVSGLKVSLSLDEEESLYDLIETSAAINAGNSGGPLLNMKGEVIGITSAKIASVGVEGMGYAISINSALPILQELINKGYITRPFLGVELYTVNDYVAYYNGLAVNRGAIVTTIQPGSPL